MTLSNDEYLQLLTDCTNFYNSLNRFRAFPFEVCDKFAVTRDDLSIILGAKGRECLDSLESSYTVQDAEIFLLRLSVYLRSRLPRGVDVPDFILSSEDLANTLDLMVSLRSYDPWDYRR